jgi:hypothetical protein
MSCSYYSPLHFTIEHCKLNNYMQSPFYFVKQRISYKILILFEQKSRKIVTRKLIKIIPGYTERRPHLIILSQLFGLTVGILYCYLFLFDANVNFLCFSNSSFFNHNLSHFDHLFTHLYLLCPKGNHFFGF